MSKKKNKDVKKKPTAVTKPLTKAQLLCKEAMELMKDRPQLKLRIKGGGFSLVNPQPPPWGFTMKGKLKEPELVALIERIKNTPTRG